MNRVMTRTRYRQPSAAFTVSREYDALDRVTSSYAYDLCGNRLSVVTPTGTVSSTYTHNRRDADTYDAGGRVTRTVNGRGQLLDLAWNLQGELVSVSTNGVFAEGYAYDPMGRRISTTDANGTVYHAYDGIHCVADLAPDGTLLRSYTWGSGVDNLLAVTFYSAAETNTLYAVTDPLGTVHALVGTNDTSQLLSLPASQLHFTYDSWGNPTVASQPFSFSASQLRFTWQGREYSNATGLYSFRARWYDPAAGRWLSKDPIGLEGGLNLYEAFGSNPVCFGDPDGFSGRLTIHSRRGEGGSLDGHSWISYTSNDLPITTTYGTWGLKTKKGLMINAEKRYSSDESRCAYIDDDHELKLFLLIFDYIDRKDDGWTYLNPCSGFASDAWRVATGEVLRDRGFLGVISTPSTLADSIRAANGTVKKHKGSVSKSSL